MVLVNIGVIHSIVDVITNSSTVIYTYQNSTKQAEELLNEILKLLGETKTAKELFYLGEFLEESDVYSEYLDRLEEDEEDEITRPDDWPDDYKQESIYIKAIQEKVMKGEIVKPKWMIDAEQAENDDGFMYPKKLCILPKEEKYTALVEKMISFLNSPDHEAFRDG